MAMAVCACAVFVLALMTHVAKATNGADDARKKHTMTPFDAAKTRRLKRMFDSYDKTGNGTINEDHLRSLFLDCDQDISPSEIKEVLKRYEYSSDPAVTFEPFLEMVKDLEQDPGSLKEDLFGRIWKRFVSNNNLADLVKKDT